MKLSTLLTRAEVHRRKMEVALSEINDQVKELLEDDACFVFHQPGDGWVVCYNDGYNAMIGTKDIDQLINCSTREQAIEFLDLRSI